MQANISTALGGWKDSSYPPGIKYYPSEMVISKIIYNGSLNTSKHLFIEATQPVLKDVVD